MVFKTFVQVGRAVIITKGPESGKLAVIGILPLPHYLEMSTNQLLAVEIISEKSVSSPP
jgi:hypothetical protein